MRKKTNKSFTCTVLGGGGRGAREVTVNFLFFVVVIVNLLTFKSGYYLNFLFFVVLLALRLVVSFLVVYFYYLVYTSQGLVVLFY